MKSNKKLIIILVCLALVCIGAAELIACRHFNRPLYDEITAPVIHAANIVQDTADDFFSSIGSFLSKAGKKIGTFFKSNDPATGDTASDISDLGGSSETNESRPFEDGQVVSEPVIDDAEPVTDPAITELQEIGGLDILTGGSKKIVYYNQGDDEWKNMPYGSDYIGRYGCGPVAMAMVVASMTDQETDPAAMASWAADHGYWARQSGSYLSIIPGTSEAYGLACSPLSEKTPEAVRNALLSGKLIVALMGPGHFTRGGHFIILRGITLTGEVLVADPASLDRSLTTWDPQLILDELSKSTSDGAPIWVISN